MANRRAWSPIRWAAGLPDAALSIARRDHLASPDGTGGRLVMLRTPCLGSLIATALTAEDKMVRAGWLSRPAQQPRRINRSLASMPGTYQLLPVAGPYSPIATTPRLRPVPMEDRIVKPELLAEARHIHETLATNGFDPERMFT
jgi:hypothetical protein